MAAKYPSIAHSARDVQEVLVELNKYLKEVTTYVRLDPTPKDPHRTCLYGVGFRRMPQIGSPSRIEAKVYVPGNRQTSFDRALCDVLWEMLQSFEGTPKEWGSFTSLTQTPFPAPK